MSQCEIVGTDVLVEFLEVAFNNILHARNFYPTEMFVMKKSYTTAVHISQHPELNEYIENILKTIRRWIATDRSAVSAINMKFFNKDKCLIEKYVFNLINVESDNFFVRDPYFVKIEQLLRSLNLELSMAISYLKPLPEESSFSIDVDVRQSAHVALCETSLSQNFPWILNPESTSSFQDIQPSDGTKYDSGITRKSSLLPLIAINNCSLRLDLFVVQVSENRPLIKSSDA